MRLPWLLIASLAIASPAFAQANPDLSSFPKWNRVVAREHVLPPKKPFDGDLKQELDAIHAKYRRVPFMEDMQNYGVADYWATRAEMRKKGAGDCEDFAIAEYFDLLEMGMPENQLWVAIVIARDLGKIHAVLLAGDWILDSRLPSPIPASMAPGYYTPVYRINRTGWILD